MEITLRLPRILHLKLLNHLYTISLLKELSISGQIRTITTQSISGNEIPYVNAGFEDVVLNANNFLDSPRAVFSKVNEDRKLDFY